VSLLSPLRPVLGNGEPLIEVLGSIYIYVALSVTPCYRGASVYLGSKTLRPVNVRRKDARCSPLELAGALAFL